MFGIGHRNEARFLEAAWSGDEEQVHELLTGKLELLNARACQSICRNHRAFEEGATALHLAVAGEHRAVVGLLLSLKADVNLTTRLGSTPLHLAAALGHMDIAAALLDHGAKLDLPDASGRTPLHVAALAGEEEVVELLIRRGCRLDQRDSEGNSVMHAAAWGRSAAIIRRLASMKMKINGHNAKGRTPLHMVVLPSEGAPVAQDVPREPDFTALEAMRTLLELGADVNAHDAAGETPLDLLSSHEFHPRQNPLMELLVSHGGICVRHKPRQSSGSAAAATAANQVAAAPMTGGGVALAPSPATERPRTGLIGGSTPIPLERNKPLIIGRSSDCDVRYLSRTLSRHHAKIEAQGSFYLISDMGSHNGVVINDHRITGPSRLKPGDLISLGAYDFEFDGTRLIPTHGELPVEKLAKEREM